jgi:hypothetical protein
MQSIEFVKKLIIQRLNQKSDNENLILNEIIVDIQSNSISQDEVETALTELRNEGKIRIIDIRSGMLWQLIIKRP